MLQAFASISDPRWWAILDIGPLARDLFAALAAALHWINHCDGFVKLDSKPALMRELELGLRQECGLSPSLDQDVHEALLQVLEAVYDGLVRRGLAAARQSQSRTSWDPLNPWPRSGSTAWATTTAARQAFFDLWQGVFEETRSCCTCSYTKVLCDPDAQAFRCLSLDLPPIGRMDLTRELSHTYQGLASERLEGVLCTRCSANSSLEDWRRKVLGGDCVGALQAFSRLQHLIAAEPDARLPQPEQLRVIIPAWAPPPVLQRTVQTQRCRIAQPPQILVLHLRRLMIGPYGLVKSEAGVLYPPVLHVSSIGKCKATTNQHGTVDPYKLACSNEYVLRSVVSHLGPPTAGHFLAHRRWHDVPADIVAKASAHGILAGAQLLGSLPILGPAAQAAGFASKCLATKSWVRADDDRVQETTEGEALRFPGTYLLFYERSPGT